MYEMMKPKKGYESCDISANYTYGSHNSRLPFSSSEQMQLVNISGHFPQVYHNECDTKRKNAYLRGTTNPDNRHRHELRARGYPIQAPNGSNYPSSNFNSFDSVPSLNEVAANLSTNGCDAIPLNRFSAIGSQRYAENKGGDRRSNRPRRTLPKINPNTRLDMSPPSKDRLKDSFNHNLSASSALKKSGVPLRKRVRSTNSTESTDSHSGKFTKTPQGRGQRAKRDTSEAGFAKTRFRKNSSPKRSTNTELYNKDDSCQLRRNRKRLALDSLSDTVDPKVVQSLHLSMKNVSYDQKLFQENGMIVPRLNF